MGIWAMASGTLQTPHFPLGTVALTAATSPLFTWFLLRKVRCAVLIYFLRYRSMCRSLVFHLSRKLGTRNLPAIRCGRSIRSKTYFNQRRPSNNCQEGARFLALGIEELSFVLPMRLVLEIGQADSTVGYPLRRLPGILQEIMRYMSSSSRI
jgi:hypothetical protein